MFFSRYSAFLLLFHKLRFYCPKKKIYLFIVAALSDVFDLELEHRNAQFADLGQYCKVILL